MNGTNGQFPQPGAAIWQEHRTADGRTYYYNTATKVTQWTKPEDMMSPAEVSAASQSCNVCAPNDINVLTVSAARSREPALEGIHRRGWQEVLV